MSSTTNLGGNFQKLNWRKDLLANARVCNCPCRGSKPNYKSKQKFLNHIKRWHPEKLEEITEAFDQADRTG